MLNALWLGFFIIGAIAALAQWLVGGQSQVFASMVQALNEVARGRADAGRLVYR